MKMHLNISLQLALVLLYLVKSRQMYLIKNSSCAPAYNWVLLSGRRVVSQCEL